ncbi:MAG: o-succinylbenzoate synthase [Parachlamydiales bacterium]|jgi:O-succinylbenzoate synthase
MKIKELVIELFEIALTGGAKRSGAILRIKDEAGKTAQGEISPLPGWNNETLQESLEQVKNKKDEILSIDWAKSTFFYHLQKLDLYPSVLFGLESALLQLYFPIESIAAQSAALLMGQPEDILKHAKQRKSEGYSHAKLKVSELTFNDAANIIHQLKNTFRLRVDVNRAWKTQEAIEFFEQFPTDTFDYVEEPFQNSDDLSLFDHPLALDESYHGLDLDRFANLPTLKALIYKPTVQGGLLNCLSILSWARQFQVDLVLSSSFESTIGLDHIRSMAQRLSLTSPVGIGTQHYMS